MLSIILWLVTIGITFYISLIYHSPSLALLGYAQAVLLAVSGLFLVYRMRTLSCHVQIPIAIAECGRPLTVRFVVENCSFLPCSKLKCCVVQRSSFLEKSRKTWIRLCTAMPGKNSYEQKVEWNEYGSYELLLQKVRIYDLTGLLYLHKKTASCGAVQVLPRMQEVGVHLSEAARNFFGDADVYDDFQPGHDHSELFQLRPFQNGDKIQGIHWKLSAKMDELLVREDSLPRACPVVFLLDYCRTKQKKEQKVHAYLMILASISYSLMDAGCPHYAAWYSSSQKEMVRVRVDDEESLYLFLSGYLEEAFQEKVRDPLAAYQEKYRGEHWLHVLCLNEALELKKDGETIETFTAKGWEKTLGGLEVIV